MASQISRAKHGSHYRNHHPEPGNHQEKPKDVHENIEKPLLIFDGVSIEYSASCKGRIHAKRIRCDSQALHAISNKPGFCPPLQLPADFRRYWLLVAALFSGRIGFAALADPI
jgi:hypothetical protein